MKKTIILFFMAIGITIGYAQGANKEKSAKGKEKAEASKEAGKAKGEAASAEGKAKAEANKGGAKGEAASAEGKAKAEAYGDEIIDIVESYCHRYGLESNMDAKSGNPKRVRAVKPKLDKTPTKEISLQMYKAGKTVAEIAKERNFAISTIEGHLSNYLSTGEVKLDDLVPISIQEQIKSVIEKVDSINVTTVKAELPETIDYGAVRLVIASMNTPD